MREVLLKKKKNLVKPHPEHVHLLPHKCQDQLCFWSRRLSRVTFCQLPEPCCFWSPSPADVMRFFPPAHSSVPANLPQPALISLARLPLGEGAHRCRRSLSSPDSTDSRGSSLSGPGLRFKGLTSFHWQKLPLNCYRSESPKHVN